MDFVFNTCRISNHHFVQGISLSIEQYKTLLKNIPAINEELKTHGLVLNDADSSDDSSDADKESSPAVSVKKESKKELKKKPAAKKANIEATSDEESDDEAK